MGNDFMLVFEFHAECGVRKQLRHDAGKFQEFFLCHPLPDVKDCRKGLCPKPRKLAESIGAHNCERRYSLPGADGKKRARIRSSNCSRRSRYAFMRCSRLPSITVGSGVGQYSTSLASVRVSSSA